ncbi:WecB/TagA/CpsF family glycosyltransferase [Marivita sp.]|uniref:WecB/TagA/CpsF family glycosyltransferase n=2 Tax=unclassified Marivita TaxID=2632480 RepID=UPI003B5244F5
MTHVDPLELTRQEALMRFWGDAFDVAVNVPDWVVLERQISSRLRAGEGFSLATINLDHLVKLRKDVRFRDAYAAQDLVVADGNPIVWMSKLAGRPVSLIPGSDAILPLVRIAAAHGKTLALVGSTDDTLAAAKTYLERKVPGTRIVATIAPPMGFDPAGSSADSVLDALHEAGADMAFLALGAPKQELFAAHGRRKLGHVGFVSIGAGLDFFSGAQVRAPAWVRAIAMEWLWRALSQPARLIPRYAKCFGILPVELFHALKLRFDPAQITPARQGK